MPKTKLALTIPAALLLMTQSVFAETHVVTAEGMKFAPLVVKIAPGDTVRWDNMPTHNVETIDGLVPEGTEKLTPRWAKTISIPLRKKVFMSTNVHRISVLEWAVRLSSVSYKP